MFEFSLFGSFLMDAANVLSFGRQVSDLANNEDASGPTPARRNRPLPERERQARADQIAQMRRRKRSHSKQRSR